MRKKFLVVALVVAILVTILCYLGYLKANGLNIIPLPNSSHIVWKNVQFTKTRLKFGVNYTMICNIHKFEGYSYCNDGVIEKRGAVPGTAYKILGCVTYPTVLAITARCSSISLNLPGCYDVTLRIYANYDLYVITYRNKTGVYRYVYRVKCGPITEKNFREIFQPLPNARPTDYLQVILYVPTIKIDFRSGRVYLVNYTEACGWFVVYRLR